jgi:SAM-dependent methyltransferase
LNEENEMQIYDRLEASRLSGEIESYDNAFFPNVIRKRELQLITQLIQAEKPSFILDYGCGGGWLSKLLQKWRFEFVGLDISRNMIRNAKKVCPDSDFIVCDSMMLPFKGHVFDFVIGISILHHLDFERAINELKRVSIIRTTLLFMEPNLLNPFSAFGRRFFPMEAHTKGEKACTPANLNRVLNLANLHVERCFAMFFLAFPVARFSKISKLRPPSALVKMTYFFESLMEKMPGIRYLNSNIVAIVKTD